MTSGDISIGKDGLPDRSSPLRLIHGTGEMADLIRTRDWSLTPLGPMPEWSETLLATVNTMLGTLIPMQVLWGPELVVLYNDALRPPFSDKHPRSLGQPARSVWEEVWPIVGSQIEGVLRRAEAVSFRSVLLPLLHNGVLEDTYWDYSYSPIFDLQGTAAGVLNIAQNVTEAVVGQQQLRASEARATRILHSIGDAVIVTDAEARVSRMNPVAESLTGWSLDEAEGRPLSEIFQIVNEATRLSVESPADKVKRLGAIVGLANHTILIAKNGAEVHIDDSGAPIRNDAGELTGIVLVFRNVEEQRKAERLRLQAEAVLRTERTRLLQVFEQAPAFFAVMDGPTHIISMVNPLYLKLVGNRDVLGKTLAEAVPEATEQGYVAMLDQIMATGERITGSGARFAVEWEPGKPREERFVDFVFQPLQELDGTVLSLVIFGVDVTERVRSEQALRQNEEALRMSREALRLSLDAGRAGTFDWDIRTGRVVWSAELELLYGAAPGTFEGMLSDWRKRVIAEDEQRIVVEIEDLLRRQQQDYGYEFRAVMPDGNLRWLRGQARFIYDPDGKPSRMSGINIDINERKLGEEALIRNEKLAAVGRLAASIAHEINNPLESVTNLIYLAKASDKLSDAREYLASADVELRRASAITSHTLRFHRQATRPTEVTCESLSESVLAIYHSRIVNSGISMEKRRRGRRGVVCFDGEIRQVLSNLVGNAIDAMSPAGGRLLLRSRDGTDWRTGRKGVLVTVGDTGPGMSTHTAGRAREAFFTTKGQGGTGLGLWISQEIIDRHKGRLSLRSSQRKGRSGTVFAMFLPYDAVSR